MNALRFTIILLAATGELAMRAQDVLAAQAATPSSSPATLEPPGQASLRAAIQDLQAAFPTQYARANEFLERLGALQRRWAQAEAGQREGRGAGVRATEAGGPAGQPAGRPAADPVRHPRQYVNDHGPEETMYQSNEHNAALLPRRRGNEGARRATGSVRTSWKCRKASSATRTCISTAARSSSRCAATDRTTTISTRSTPMGGTCGN